MKFTYLLYVLGSALLFFSCKKTVEIDLPEVEQSFVVEGTIEKGRQPMVILTETQGYFDPASAESIFGTFVHAATVEVISNGVTYPLQEICSQDIPDSLLGIVSALTGVPVYLLTTFNYCVYTTFDPSIAGVEGSAYHLAIDIEGEKLSANTKIPIAIPLDSIRFQVRDDLDSLGFLWNILSDPADEVNYYRWYAQRLNKHTFGKEKGEVKDPFPIAPYGSAFNDNFFNGLSFEFPYNRGEIGTLESQDDEGPEEGYFKIGDTVLVKFVATPRDYFLYIRSLDNQAATSGSPFSSPGNLEYNITGGIGIWAGLAPVFDTIICQ